MDNIYITFEVTISETDYYGGKRKTARCTIATPRDILDNFNPGDIFVACLKSALIEYDYDEEEIKENK